MAVEPEQDRTPYLDALVEFRRRDPLHLHVPGTSPVARPIPRSIRAWDVLPSIGGISHAQIEDTAEADLLTAIAAYGTWAGEVVQRLVPDPRP